MLFSIHILWQENSRIAYERASQYPNSLLQRGGGSKDGRGPAGAGPRALVEFTISSRLFSSCIVRLCPLHYAAFASLLCPVCRRRKNQMPHFTLQHLADRRRPLHATHCAFQTQQCLKEEAAKIYGHTVHSSNGPEMVCKTYLCRTSRTAE